LKKSPEALAKKTHHFLRNFGPQLDEGGLECIQIVVVLGAGLLLQDGPKAEVKGVEIQLLGGHSSLDTNHKI
jgi:hypothetical protein